MTKEKKLSAKAIFSHVWMGKEVRAGEINEHLEHLVSNYFW